MSSWKYVRAWASPKGTLIYSYFQNGEVNTVLEIEDLSKGIWWYPGHRSNVEKYFTPFNWGKISSNLGMGQINFLVTLLSAWYSVTKCFPPSPFGHL